MKPILKEGQDVLFPRQTNYHHGGIMSLNSALQAYAWELMKESHGDNILLWQEDSQPFHNEFMNGNFNDTGKPIDLWTWKDYEKVIFIR